MTLALMDWGHRPYVKNGMDADSGYDKPKKEREKILLTMATGSTAEDSITIARWTSTSTHEKTNTLPQRKAKSVKSLLVS